MPRNRPASSRASVTSQEIDLYGETGAVCVIQQPPGRKARHECSRRYDLRDREMARKKDRQTTGIASQCHAGPFIPDQR
jgi:hypothetical protein